MPRVLVIDDSASIRKSVKFILEKEGYAVLEAVNGADGIEKLDNEIDLIVSDVNMPEMDGIEMIRAIRSGSTAKTVPIIILTTESQEDVKNRGKEAGATAWLNKPFEPKGLLEVINRVIG